MKWLEDNFFLLFLVLGLILLVFWKGKDFFASIGQGLGLSSGQTPADATTAASHLHRPERIPDGSNAATQKAYAERMQVYSAAVAANRLYEINSHVSFFGREDDIMKLLRVIVSDGIPLSLLEAEYAHYEKTALLLRLQWFLSSSNYRWFLSHVKSK